MWLLLYIIYLRWQGCVHTDVDECSPLSQEADTKPPCTQICLNTMGSYLCACHYGFKLAADRRTCVREFYTKQDHKISRAYTD